MIRSITYTRENNVAETGTDCSSESQAFGNNSFFLILKSDLILTLFTPCLNSIENKMMNSIIRIFFNFLLWVLSAYTRTLIVINPKNNGVTSIIKNFFVYREHNDSTICSSSEISWTTKPNNFLNRLACTKMEYSQEVCRRLLLKNLWKLTLFLAFHRDQVLYFPRSFLQLPKSLRALYYNFQKPLRVWRHNENCLLRLFISNIVF